MPHKSICILVSGSGSGMLSIQESINRGAIPATVLKVIIDRPNSIAETRARDQGMPVQVIDRKDQFFRKRLEDELLKINPDFIVLAGFLSILPDSILDNFRHRIINTHPALLPCFGGMGMYGLRVHRAVIESGARYSGCTIHLVTGEVDGGPIIAQSIVEVKDNDTAESLSDRVKEAEHLLMTETLRKLLTSDYAVSGKRVVFS